MEQQSDRATLRRSDRRYRKYRKKGPNWQADARIWQLLLPFPQSCPSTARWDGLKRPFCCLLVYGCLGLAAASIYGKLATQNEICFEAPRQRMPYIAIQIKRKQRPAGGATAAAAAAAVGSNVVGSRN